MDAGDERVDMEHGFKRNILPDHCGKCVFLDWEEQSCTCTHPSFVYDSELLEYLLEEPVGDSDEEVVCKAKEFYGMHLDDSDWHGYDSICDLYVQQKSQKQDDAIIGAIMEQYENRALKLWHNRPKSEEERGVED